jgi:hypothetical protein
MLLLSAVATMQANMRVPAENDLGGPSGLSTRQDVCFGAVSPIADRQLTAKRGHQHVTEHPKADMPKFRRVKSTASGFLRFPNLLPNSGHSLLPATAIGTLWPMEMHDSDWGRSAHDSEWGISVECRS